MQEAINTLTWQKLSEFSTKQKDLINGPNNSHSLLRLFGETQSSVRVIFYRDNHAWCPYCQKVWLWLEWKRIPYQIKKATMRCYGNKEDWYLKKVPSGIFPAIELDNQIITESDQILLSLENAFGPLGTSLKDPEILDLRNLERRLFRSWCIWLCNQSFNKRDSFRKEEQFKLIAQEMDTKLSRSSSCWLDKVSPKSKGLPPGSIDIVFVPYLERMNASLAYYKGLNIRKEFPYIDKWFRGLERFDEYLGTQGDFHTHAHDLPPQMGGCWVDKNVKQAFLSHQIDIGKGVGEEETTFQYQDEKLPAAIALEKVLKHRERIKRVNPLGPELFDQPLRAALSSMVLEQSFQPSKGSAKGLRYLRDRISVPRDMPLLSARKLRQSLEKTAALDSGEQGPTISKRNRFDQNPIYFS